MDSTGEPRASPTPEPRARGRTRWQYSALILLLTITFVGVYFVLPSYGPTHCGASFLFDLIQGAEGITPVESVEYRSDSLGFASLYRNHWREEILWSESCRFTACSAEGDLFPPSEEARIRAACIELIREEYPNWLPEGRDLMVDYFEFGAAWHVLIPICLALAILSAEVIIALRSAFARRRRRWSPTQTHEPGTEAS